MKSLARSALLLLALAAASLGCDAEPYCLNCEFNPMRPDGALDVTPLDASRPETCVPSNGGTEICDGRDNNCNGRVDEGFDTQSDPLHCGGCGMANDCRRPHTIPGCTAGRCTIRQCDSGWRDLNMNPDDGCEYACVPTGDREVCDGRDNDCNGLVDEGFDLTSNVSNCGRCGNACVFDRAEAACVAGVCRMGACRAGAVDRDGNPANGCEYACTPSGPEVCDGRDNDCDGTVDNGINLDTDPANCGACGRSCSMVHARPTCAAGRCSLPAGACLPGYIDLNRDASDGCEWACGDPATGRTGVEQCNARDDDCNGLIDDGAVMGVGDACGPSSMGVCRRGTNACERGVMRCIGATTPGTEFCNGLDDDCNGVVDDPPPGASLPGTGPTTVCGNNVGACNFGRFTCTAGAIVCTGVTGPSTEVCDGVDNDCDGRVDEDVSVPAGFRCNRRGAESTGVCAAARPFCGGLRMWQCTYPPTYRDRDQEALCDGIDNNCDGATDEGCLRSLGAEVRLDAGSRANSIQPAWAGNGARGVALAYIDRRNGEADIYFTRSLDNGLTWPADQRVDTGVAGSFNSVQPAIAWSASDIVAAWGDFRGPGSNPSEFRQVFVNRSINSGATWGATDRRINVGQDDDSFNLHVRFTPAGAVAVWEAIYNSLRGRHIWSSFSSDRGVTWGPVQQVDNGPAAAVASTPDVTLGQGNRVHVTWRDNRSGSPDIYVRTSLDGGASWGARDARVDTDAPGTHASEEPSISADGAGNVYVAWQDVRTGMAYDIYFNRSVDNGLTWLPADVRLDTDTFAQDSIRPTVMALPSRGVSVVWEDRRWGLPTPYANRSQDAGATWMVSDVQAVGGRPGQFRVYNLVAAASGDTVFAVWADDRGGALDIWGNYSLDGGGIFQPVDVRFDASPAGSSDSNNPVVLANVEAGSPMVHVAWVDRRVDGTTGDIFYRRFTR